MGEKGTKRKKNESSNHNLVLKKKFYAIKIIWKL